MTPEQEAWKWMQDFEAWRFRTQSRDDLRVKSILDAWIGCVFSNG